MVRAHGRRAGISSVDDLESDSVNTGEAQINTQTGIGIPDSSSSNPPGFGNWTTANSSRPSVLLVEAFAETDGNTRGLVDIIVDESGGTTGDYAIAAALADSESPSGVGIRETSFLIMPEGASYQIRNNDDPNNVNEIKQVRQFDL
jgi:hypothetical protein